VEINPYIWAVVGALAGLLAGVMMGGSKPVNRIEEVLVGVFGAFIGGEFVASAFAGGRPPGQFTIGALAFAVAGALVLLFLLKLMRGAVGPLIGGKRKTRR
jgi:uncharacterized membrane protein YeaQ/YmgE (transglycosylase-associated protein family)